MRVLLLHLLLLACPLVLMAQAGTLKGKVTNRQTAEALPGATVQLKGSSAMAITDNDGYFTLSPVPAGSITLLVSYSGYEKAALPVTVREGTTMVDVALTLLDQTGNEVVVSASRRPQKITSAPAAISVIDSKDLEQFAGSNTGELMAYVQGVEFVRSGVDQTLFNARGFNNAFNSKVLQIIDGRNSMNTGSGGLALGNGATLVKEDIERIEVVLGPQSALYGPNAHNMLINTITKDPRKYPGTVVALGGGSREQMSGRFRHANVLNHQWAYKLSGEYVTGKEYEFYDSVRAGGGGVYGPAVIIPERIRDFDFRRIRGEGHVYYSVTPRTDIIVTGGASTNDYIQVTASTRNQMRDINYRFLQARLVHPNYFVTAYNAWGGLGTSYTIGSYTRDYWNRTHSIITDKTDPRFPTMGRLSPDEAEAAALKTRFNERNQRFNAEAQYNDSFNKAGLFVVAGLSYQEDKPNSFGTTLIDKDRRIYVTQYGMVLQLEKSLPFKLRFIGAARYDNHNKFGDFISPRLGLVKAVKEGSVRLTWGRAYSMPSILFRSANINGFFFGNGEGITYIPNGAREDDPSSVRVTTPLEPEQVSTWEVGYKGRLKEKLYVDINYYNSISKNFLSPSRSVGGKALKVGGVSVTPTSPGKVENGILRNALFTTIFNYGEVQVYGLDAGLYYTFNRVASLALKYSWFGSDIRENDPKNDLNKDSVVSEEERSLNAPWHRGTVQLRLQNLLRQKAFLHLSGRFVEEYNFYSGNQAGTASGKGKWGAAPKNFDWGPLGGFVTMDLSAGYILNQWVSVGTHITNVFNTEQREFVASQPIGRLIMLELKVRVPDDNR